MHTGVMYVSNDSPVVLGGVVEEVGGGAVEREGGDWEVGETDADGVADSAAAGRGAILIRAHNECTFTLTTE